MTFVARLRQHAITAPFRHRHAMTDDRCRVRSGNGCCPPCRLAISSVMDNPPAIRTPRCASVLRPLAPNCATTRPISIRSNRLLLSSMPICAKPRSARYSVAARRQTARPLPPARMRQLLRQLRLCSDLSGFCSSTRASTISPRATSTSDTGKPSCQSEKGQTTDFAVCAPSLSDGQF
jgi:hypothetical protein